MTTGSGFGLLKALDHRVVSTPEWELGATRELFAVETGAVDCFLRRLDADGQVIGSRSNLVRIEAGQIFPGLGDTNEQVEVLASCLPDTRVIAVAAETLTQTEWNDATILTLDQTLADWASSIASAHTEKLMPQSCQPAHPGVPVKLHPGACIGGGLGLVWTQVVEGRCQWMGDPATLIDPQAGFLPLSNKIWLVAQDPSEFEVITTADLIDRGAFWDVLQAHYGCVIRQIVRALKAEDAAAPQRLVARVQSAKSLERSGLEALGAVINEATVIRGKYEANLLSAIDILGQHQGLELDLDKADMPAHADSTAALKAIAQSSGIRHREVILRDRWWESDNGNLLVKYKDRWAALITDKNGRNMLHCPTTKIVVRANEAIAETLSPQAIYLYRSFPDDEMKPIAVLKFALFGLRRDLIMVLLIGLTVGLLGMILPILTGQVVEHVIPSGQRFDMGTVGAALIAVTISTSLFTLTRSISLLRLESRMSGAVQAAVWDRLLKLPATFFRDYTAGDLSTRVDAFNAIRRALSGTTISGILATFFSVANLFLLFYYDLKVAGIALGLVLVAVLFMSGIGYAKLQYEKKIAAAAGKLAGRLFEILSGMNKLRAAAAESRAFYNWSTHYAALQNLRFRAGRIGIWDNVFFSGYQLLVSAVIFTAVGMALIEPQTEGMSIGDFVAFNAAFGAFFAGMATLVDTALGLLNLIPLYQRARPILEAIPENTADKEVLADPHGRIEVANVSFHYPDGPPVLKNITMTINPGEFVAIVGPSGSGKSTLLRLLMGFETAQTGSIHYDGRSLDRLDLVDLRKRMGIVLQAGKLIAGDVYTNIAGAFDLTLDQAWEAARLVGLEQDILQMPMGMHTLIGEGATTLSGGQRQRILIARAIANRPRIVFFDEATSALDNTTQAIVSDSLEHLKATRVVIAHRLSTIIKADTIYALDRGAIVQRGAFEDLRDQDGLFKSLVSRQLL
ncbi:MAG: NHLP bacteriocin export ABC transporter permease/ATPase subunit [bacterium]|nr:NHLP bacteriocin export ABC transporter permease/ATPase subunit [bacterium]